MTLIFLVIFMGFASVFQVLGSVNASIRLYTSLLRSIMKAPVTFFDTTPVGRILNRFGQVFCFLMNKHLKYLNLFFKGFDTIDVGLSASFRFLMYSFGGIVQLVIVIFISTPLFIIVSIPIAFIYFLILVNF